MQKVCRKCGAEFDGHFNQLYCSDQCRLAVGREASQAKRDEARALGRTCVVCGKIFYPRHLGKQTCSDDCARQLLYDRRNGIGDHIRVGSTIPCARCGKMFTVKTPTAKYCSTTCYKKASYEINRLRYTADRPEDFQRRPKRRYKSLEECVREAAKRGLSYGQYVYRMEGGML